MQLAQWVALGVIPLIVFIGFLKPDVASRPEPGSAVPDVTVAEPTPAAAITTDDGAKVRLDRVGGGTVAVSAAAVEVATAAGLATWTGDWEGVPVSGPTPTAPGQFPNADIGDLVVFVAEGDLVTFAVQLDSEGDGRFEQSFQISVVRENGSWVYPTTAG